MEIEWLQDELLTGFQKLLCLGLERQPAAEVLAGTALTWVEALTEGLDWDRERDVDRVRRAFITLAATRTSWPAPAHFREALSPPSDQLQIEQKLAIPETREARMRRLGDLIPADLRGKDAAAEQGVSP